MVNYIRLEPWKQEICKYFRQHKERILKEETSGLDLLTPSSKQIPPSAPGPLRYIEDDVSFLFLLKISTQNSCLYMFILLRDCYIFSVRIEILSRSFTFRSLSGGLLTTLLKFVLPRLLSAPSFASKNTCSKNGLGAL